MKKLIYFLILFFNLTFFSLLLSLQPVRAADCAIDITPWPLIAGPGEGATFDPNSPNVTFSQQITGCPQEGGSKYVFQFNCAPRETEKEVPVVNGRISFTFTNSNPCELTVGSHQVKLFRDNQKVNELSYDVRRARNPRNESCNPIIESAHGDAPSINDPVTISVDTNTLLAEDYYFGLSPGSSRRIQGKTGRQELIKDQRLNLGNYRTYVETPQYEGLPSQLICEKSFVVSPEGGVRPTPPGYEPTMCDGGKGVQTALGCLPTNISDFIGKFLLRWAVGLAGVAALFLIIFAGFQIMTAAGNPEKLQAGRELLTSAIIGLLFIIFSVVLLQVIGIKILEIPNFPQFGQNTSQEVKRVAPGNKYIPE